MNWWKYPFKPVRVDEKIFDQIDLSQYTMELKFDGFRCILIQGKNPTLWTREKNKIEMTENLVKQTESLNLPEGTVLDGEIWTPEKRGKWRHNKSVQCLLSFWDILRYGGGDLGTQSIEKRRESLGGALRGSKEDITIVETFPASKLKFLEIKEQAFEHRETTGTRSGFIHGVVLKRNGSPRRDHATRSINHPDWLKIVWF